MDETKDIVNVKGIIRRRKIVFTVAFLLIFVIGAAVAFLLPPVYISQSTILIEDQQIPQEYVLTTITGYVEERLQMITQQIMSRTKLMEVINRFNLYEDLRDRYTTEEIVDEMRDDILFKTISADVMDTRTGRATAATIAFTLSYEGKDPSKVQNVANVLASLYLEENLKNREQLASNTTNFLQEEMDQRKKEIEEIQTRIGEFKEAHLGELPEFSTVNLQAIGRLERELDHLNLQVNSLKERKILLGSQIANVDPLNPVVNQDGKTVMNPSERLKYLRLELIGLKGSLSEKHPDIKKLKREIRELESQVGASEDSVNRVRRLNDLRGQLAASQGKLGPKHPEVIKLKKEVEALSGEIEKMSTAGFEQQVGENKPDNPAYINLQTQIAATDMEIRSLLKEFGEIRGEIARYQLRMENAPKVEQEYNTLLRDYENARLKHNEISSKLMEAKVAQGMEETQRGERFTIVDPAQLPEKPYKPNRIAIILISFVLALGAGAGLAAVRETLDTTVKSTDELVRFSGIPVLSVIPLLETRQEIRSRRVKRGLLVLTGLCVIVVAFIAVHLYVMPLEIFLVKVQRRMMMLM